MDSVALTERANLAFVLMKLEGAKGHKWRRNSQGLILLTSPPSDSGHSPDCIGGTCTRCGSWFCMRCAPEAVEGCPPRVYVS
jgi:hypothetical protein